MAIFALLSSGCAAQLTDRPVPSVLDTRGPAAQHIANLWWLLFGLGTVVYLVVMGAMLFALFRSRRGYREPGHEEEPKWRRVVLWGGLIIPTLILVVAYLFTLNTLRATALPENEDELVIEVVGRRWWWEVRYPNQQVVTANEIHIPVGQPVRLFLTADEVIHSFWIPQLHSKMDANPKIMNDFWLQADQPGEYWGECAEFCGVQHAKMRFLVVAQPPEEFQDWLQAQGLPSALPTDPIASEGLEVFLRSGCIGCHTIRGTDATGELGPDLTHFASRRTLGSGAIENNRGGLGGWISDPHSIKPGNLMPPTALSAEELNALLAYMESLR